MWVTILAFVVILGLLVFVHEFGHFMAAKRFGIKVEEFGFGFPPRMIGLRRGETIYSLNWIPLGGFVKIKGEQGDERAAIDSFSAKPAWQRIVVLAAGVLMNFFLAFLLYAGGLSIGLPQTLSDEEAVALNVASAPVIISQVMDKSPAADAQLRVGDQIVSIEDQTVDSIAVTKEKLSLRASQPTVVKIKRGNENLVVTVQPRVIDGSQQPLIGIGLSRMGVVRYNFFEAIWRGLQATVSMIIAIIFAFGWLLKSLLFTGRVGADVAGPIGVAVITNQVVQLGWAYIITFTAALSINLGIINILPFPALDGGRILFVLIEKIKGHPVSEKVESAAHNIGFSLLLLLMVVVTFHDFLRYGGSIWNYLVSIF